MPLRASSSQYRWMFAAAVLIGLLVLLWTALSPSGPFRASVDSLPDFKQWPAGPDRKRQFFAFMRPLLEAENARVLADRQRLQRIAQHADTADLGWLDRRRLAGLAEIYRIEDPGLTGQALVDELLLRVDAVPVSLGLAQAAKESAWGTSRFAREGFNLYGQRCFDRGCGMIPKARKRGLKHELVRFETPAQGVASYLRNLNTHPSYAGFRQLRARLRNAGKPVLGARLAEQLVTYSERGHSYIRDIKQMIRVNGLSRPAADG